MPLNYDTIKNWHFDEIRHTYTEKDTMLYALGIGLGEDPVDASQLRYVYERDLQAFPTMSVVLGYPGFWMRDPRAGIDWVRLVHGEQRLTLHGTLPAQGTVIARSRITHVIDKGADKGALVVTERTLHGLDGQHLATLAQTSFCRGDGGFGQGDAPPAALPAPPERAPDRQVTLRVSPRAALIYRLSADMNPLHADPEVARKAGFERPILHGLCTYGMAARAVVQAWAEGDASRLAQLDVRFSSPVIPGETLAFDMWREGDEIRYTARSVERNVLTLNCGVAKVK
ncbi:3-alpha,7-alpha,12-alpha-trihydroxy-5-beta-cholest-24-enoyl-CoA hydratase [Bordetella genomosp. 10]|uniref:3-alpha,7-alpha, 12-alpha-trihydroxy-5-beta-cholest-24-enoyl-CoA hydratase n=1 Tax=Bordetella genomosp. 10 TaxID=1416804 RepID=A0A261S0B6_9BORD|nr:MaoC/PaaZ C-terminal domain-containing protein [Bordetella genomosp. 10]OZI29963.1 3-alpha,7-alpha,12-alpha-trihydroxy-5-beta-cholest-24-enoyl-CoA hydratase [Bordetella genomosp. 10]